MNYYYSQNIMILHSPLLTKISSSKFVYSLIILSKDSLNKNGKLVFISSSHSQVNSSLIGFRHKTCTSGIDLFLKTCSFRTKILMGLSRYERFS